MTPSPRADARATEEGSAASRPHRAPPNPSHATLGAVAYPVRFGIKLNQSHHPIDVHRDAWRMAEDAGFDHIWGYDHLFALGPDPTKPIFDGWTILGAMALATKRARIGLNVTGHLYRHPGLLAKIAVTVDHLSGGRLEMGLGAAWNEPEFKMHGLPRVEAPLDRAAGDVQGTLLSAERCGRRAEAGAEAASAHLDRRVRPEAHAARRREARGGLELERT